MSSRKNSKRKQADELPKQDSFELVTPGKEVVSPKLNTPQDASSDSDRSRVFRSIRRRIGLEDSVSFADSGVQTDTPPRSASEHEAEAQAEDKIVST